MTVRQFETFSRRRQERGAALLTAMIIVTLVATLAVAMVWQQWRAVQVEAAERGRTQAAWVLLGALDFAQLILKEDQRASPMVTALTEPWATPLAESRLSTFLSTDAVDAGDGPEAFLSGTITDAQGRYNVMNLSAKDGSFDSQMQVMMRLCQILNLDVRVAQKIALGLQTATATKIELGAPLVPKSVSQLSWLGVDAASIETLRPYIEVLDVPNVAVNVNTTSKEVLAAVLDIDPATAQNFVTTAQRAPFKSTAPLVALQKPAVPAASAPAPLLTVSSNYFDVEGRLRLADRVLVERTLLFRVAAPNAPATVLYQERVSSLERDGSSK